MIRLRRRSKRDPGPIRTARLLLESITPALVEAESIGYGELGRALDAEVAAEWPPEHWDANVRAHIFAQTSAQPETVGWHRYMLHGEGTRLLIGCLGAFPCAAGDVEIGYSVVPSFQRRGFGSEAALAFVEWLLQQPSVHSVSAQTYETLPASVKVMQRCGMLCVGRGDEAGTVRYRRWRRAEVAFGRPS